MKCSTASFRSIDFPRTARSPTILLSSSLKIQYWLPRKIKTYTTTTRDNPKDGVNKLMMINDPEDWHEMEQAFVNVIPDLTINKSAKLQVELEQAKKELEKRAGLEKKVEEQNEVADLKFEELSFSDLNSLLCSEGAKN